MDSTTLEKRARELQREQRTEKVIADAASITRLALNDFDEPPEFRQWVARKLTKEVFLTLTHTERLAVIRYLGYERRSLRPAVRAMFDVLEPTK